MDHLKKYKINIFNNNIKIIYCKKKNILTVIGDLNTKTIKLKLKILILNNQKSLYVTQIPVKTISKNIKKKLQSLRSSTLVLIKQLLIDTSYIVYKKLNLVGIGFKAFPVNFTSEKIKILRFKLGFSHQIYFKISHNFNFFCLKKHTTLYVYGSSCQKISQTAAKIQSLKFPEPYKGKGILFANTKVKLKEGKKHK